MRSPGGWDDDHRGPVRNAAAGTTAAEPVRHPHPHPRRCAAERVHGGRHHRTHPPEEGWRPPVGRRVVGGGAVGVVGRDRVGVGRGVGRVVDRVVDRRRMGGGGAGEGAAGQPGGQGGADRGGQGGAAEPADESGPAKRSDVGRTRAGRDPDAAARWLDGVAAAPGHDFDWYGRITGYRGDPGYRDGPPGWVGPGYAIGTSEQRARWRPGWAASAGWGPPITHVSLHVGPSSDGDDGDSARRTGRGTACLWCERPVAAGDGWTGSRGHVIHPGCAGAFARWVAGRIGSRMVRRAWSPIGVASGVVAAVARSASRGRRSAVPPGRGRHTINGG